MYNKLCNKQDGIFFNIHICIRDKDRQMNLKRHTNYLISSNYAWFMVTFSSSILFAMLITKLKVSISGKGIKFI